MAPLVPLLRVSHLCYAKANTMQLGLAQTPHFKERSKKLSAKIEILKFRVSPKEKEIITNKARSCNKTVSMYLRDCALEKEIKIVNGADSIAEELRRIGNNINQIARGVNAGYITAVNLTETREELKEIWQSLNSLVRDAQ